MNERIEKYLAERPQARIETQPYPLQGSNSVVYRGTWNGEPAMFKFSIRGAARREDDALKYFADTGHVPRVLDVFHDQVLVTEFVPGRSLQATTLSGTMRDKLVDALATMVEQSMLDCGADFSFVAAFHGTLVETMERNPEILSGDAFSSTFNQIENNWPALSEQTGALYFDDIGGENILLTADHVTFVDLESVWPGNVTLQIGALVANFAENGDSDSIAVLGALLRKLSEKHSLDWAGCMAAAYLKIWIRICRFHRWNSWHTRDDMRLVSEADKQHVNRCGDKLRHIREFAANNGLQATLDSAPEP